MFGAGIKFRLFISSFVPLFAALGLRFDDAWLQRACAAIVVLGVVDTLLLVKVAPRRMAAVPVKFEKTDDAGSDVAGYAAAYLLPFLTVSKPSARDLASYGIFLGVLGLIYARSNLIQINPLFYLLGLRVSRVTSGDWSGFGISSKQLRSNVGYQAVKVGSDVMIIR